MPNPNNHLHNSDSPYLLQHKDNPVDWYPWGETALEKARREDKLLVISIGYAACHWCHVMEHESFEDDRVAAVMNEHFVSIKVDREQRPDLDSIYMAAAHLVIRSGGWPLNVIALPDGRPVYAGTYFPKEHWIQFLAFFAAKYKEDRDALEKQAAQVTAGINQLDVVPRSQERVPYTEAYLRSVWESLRGDLDFELGGNRRAPKFPMPAVWQFLLAFARLTGNSHAKDVLITTLDAMAAGGIYDHIGGGFARYSTDAEWHVPHFEKMLYDNAQLVSLYSKAYQWTKKEQYRDVVVRTLEFIGREFTSHDGGFYSSLDADSEGEEGKFYVWSQEEIKDILGDDADLFCDYYDVKQQGNWERGRNVLRVTRPLREVAAKHNMSESQANERIAHAKEKLFERRTFRVRPGLDDKTLTSWNSLMLTGYVDAYLAFQEDRFLEMALINAAFLNQKLFDENNRLKRNYRGGTATIDAFLDDYAHLINAYVALYQATLQEDWLQRARGLAEYAVDHFHDPKSGMFYYTQDRHTSLIVRTMEVSDNVIPSSNSAMAHALFKLGHYFDNRGYLTMARQMLDNVHDQFRRQPEFYANWGRLLLHEVYPPYEVAITGMNRKDVVLEMEQEYLPQVLYLGAEKESDLELLQGKFRDTTTIFVCRDKVCQEPVTEVEQALQQIAN